MSGSNEAKKDAIKDDYEILKEIKHTWPFKKHDKIKFHEQYKELKWAARLYKINYLEMLSYTLHIYSQIILEHS